MLRMTPPTCNEDHEMTEPHSSLCQQLGEIGVWFHQTAGSIPVTTGQHPYMHLVSVLCKLVSSIPTSLSFLKVFILVI